MSPLSAAIYETLVFFDAQDIALTLFELKAYLIALPQSSGQRQVASTFGIENALTGELGRLVKSHSGLYFLPGRASLVEARKQRYRMSLVRFRKARKYLSWLKFFPYLRAVGISGSQALFNSNPNSDIDLFVLTSKNRIWLARFLVSFYFQILGQRRHGDHIRDRFCLNHYLCEDLEITEDRNLYTAVEYASLIPVIGTEEFAKFWSKNNWIRDFLHDPLFEKNNVFFNFKFARVQKFFEIILDFTVGPALNWLAGLYQKQRIRLEQHIIVSDKELSFHPGSRGQKVLARFRAKLQTIEGA